MGHEIAGIVHKTGDLVSNFKEGDRVVINPSAHCGNCRYS